MGCLSCELGWLENRRKYELSYALSAKGRKEINEKFDKEKEKIKNKYKAKTL